MTIKRVDTDDLAPFERGKRFGTHAAREIHSTVESYLRFFADDAGLNLDDVRRCGRDVGERVGDFRSHLAEEAEGIAAGSGIDAEVVFAINARTELLCGGRIAGAPGECSTVGVVHPDGNAALLAQNWDFHPSVAANRVIWTVRHEKGSFTGMTEAGILAKLGVNSSGLAVGINFLSTTQDTGRGGVPIHVLLRAILQECQDVAEAASLLRRTAVTASVCISVAGRQSTGSDKVAVSSFELWPGGVERVHAGDIGGIAHANHFIAPTTATDLLASGPMASGSMSRHQQLLNQLSTGQLTDAQAVFDCLSNREVPPGGEALLRELEPGQPWLEQSATLATVLFEVPAARFWFCDRAAGDQDLSLIGSA